MKKVLKALGIIVAVITSIVYFALLIGTSIILSLGLKSSNIKDYITSVDVLELPIGAIVNDETENKLNSDETVKDFLSDALENAGFEEVEANAILNSEDIKNIVNNYIYDFFDYGFYGTEVTPELNSIEIISAIKNADIIITDEEEDGITTLIDNLNEKVNESLEVDEIDKEVVPVTENIKIGINIINSTWFKISLIGSFITFFFLIALFTWSLYKPFIWLGIPTIIVGVILSIVGSFKYLITAAIEELNSYKVIVENLVSPLLGKLMINGLIVLGSGILMVVIYTLINNYKHEKEEPKID
ncbi:MAG TPA: hypothetical protein PLX66_00735 [Bacilli bacterium]|nr:hypothetical protein [Bacilli bacterium]